MGIQLSAGVSAGTAKIAPAGTRLPYFGDYELLEEIARGGMGIVYRARQVSLNRTVAVKVLLFGQFSSDAFVQRFRTEAQAAASLQHPNIVAIHEVGEHEGQHYFSMDYIEGQSLADLAREKPVGAEQAAKYLVTVAHAIHYAHQRGVLHRDLKPSNVLIDFDGQPHVTDFGLAKRLAGDSELTLPGQVLGSPNYMPPEQADPKRGSMRPESDVYSLGAILYHLVTGRPPFVAETLEETLLQLLNAEPIAPRILNPKVPRDLETICLRCLNKDSRQRYGSAEMLAQDLERWGQGEPILARPVATAEKVWRWCKRRPLVAGLGFALCAVFAAGLTGVLWQWQRAERHATAATDQLREAYIAQARANRRTDRLGRRHESLAAVSRAAALNPSSEQRDELRNEAIACFALTDLRQTREWPIPEGGAEGTWCFDARLTLYAHRSGQDEIIVENVTDARQVARLPGVGVPVAWINCFSPDGHYLMVSYRNGTRRFWNILRCEIALTLPGGECDFSADSDLLIVSHDGSLSLYSTENWQQLRRLPVRTLMHTVEFYPDASKVAAIPAGRDQVEIIDVATGKSLTTWAVQGGLRCLQMSGDGRSLAGGTDDGRIYFWDPATGEPRLDLSAHENRVNWIEFNQDASLVASVSWDGNLRLWDAFTGQLIVSSPAMGDKVQVASDGRYLAYADARGISMLEVLLHPEFQRLSRNAEYMGAWSLGFRRDGRVLAVALAGDEIRLWNLATAKEVGTVPQLSRSVHFHPDGKRLITSGGGLYAWRVECEQGATNLLPVGPRTQLMAGSSFMYSDLSLNGRFLAVARRSNGTALVLDLENRENVVTLGPHPNIQWVAITGDGRFVATGTWQGAGVKVWNVATRQLLKDLPASRNAKVLFSPDGRWLATSADDYRVYEVASWKLQWRIPVPRDGHELNDLAFSPDGQTLAIGNHPRNIHLYATATGERLAILEPPQQAFIVALAFSPDGTTLAALQRNRAVHLWDLQRIRRQLGELNLDWDQPPYPPIAVGTPVTPLRVEISPP